MKGKMKRTLARLLVVIMVVTMMPVSGYGASSSGAWMIGSTPYDALQTAVNDVPENGTIIMQEDFTNNKTPIDAGGKNFTIDLGGNTLTNFSSVTWNDANGVTIKNGTLTANMEVIRVPSGSRIILENVTVNNNSSNYGAITVESGGELQIVTGTFSVPTNCAQDAIQVETGGTVTWGRQTAIPSGWQSAKTFTAELTTDFQATLDGENYARVNDALKDVQNGSVVTLLKDVDNIDINAAGKKFTLDLNTHVSSWLGVTAVEELTVKNGRVVGDQDYSCFNIAAGTVYLEDVNVDQMNGGNCDEPINNYGTLHIYSGEFRILHNNEPYDDPNTPAINTASGGVTTIDTGSYTDPVDWETASCFKATYAPVAEVRDSASATTGTKYATLRSALENGVEKHVYLLDNFTLEKAYGIEESLTLNLNGFTLTVDNDQSFPIHDTATVKNGTLQLKSGTYINLQTSDGETVLFEDLTVNSESFGLVEVPAGTLVLGKGDYSVSEGADFTFNVYNTGILEIKEGCATDVPESQWGTVKQMHVGSSIETGNYVISNLEESYIYKGEPLTPAITVKSVTTDRPLAAQQYNAVFSDNNKLGKAKVTIIGKNNFGGKLEKTFNLLPCAVNSVTATPAVTGPDNALTVSWTHPQAEQVSVYKVELYDGYDKLKEITTSGTQVTFGDLNRNKEYKFVITPAVSIDNATVYGQTTDPAFGTTDKTDLLTGKTITLSETSYTYDGTAKEPTVSVDGVDAGTYTVSYANNVDAGTATVTVTGTGDYKGSLSATFTIKKADMEGVKVTGKTTTYNGKAHTVAVSLPEGANVTYKTSSSGTYSTTKPTRTSAGTTTVYYKVSKANYNDVTGSVKIVVNKRSISSATLSYTKTTYSGSAKKPAVTVKNSSGTKLTKDTHYTVTYKNNVKVGRPTVTITGKGNYTGTITKRFTIVPKAPSSASATLYGYDDVKFSWSKVTGASGYNVYYKKSTSSSYTYLTRTTGISVKKANLSDGVKYTFKVVPYYKSGDTRYKSLSYKTASVYTLKKLATPTVAKSGTKVKVSWKNISGETGYQISRSTSKTGTNVVATYKTTSGTYKTVSATKGKTYYYKVRAYKVVNDKKIYGPWSDVKSFKRK